MAVKKVIQFGNPILREKSSKVTNFNSIQKIMGDLKDTLRMIQRKYDAGRAIAAPQIGYLKRIVYVNTKEASFYLINPRIIKKKSKNVYVWDSCFSCNLSFLAKIKRPKSITVEFYNEKGEKKKSEFSGDYSELIDHEIDHLDGILFIDHIKNPKLIMMLEEWKRKYKNNKNY